MTYGHVRDWLRHTRQVQDVVADAKVGLMDLHLAGLPLPLLLAVKVVHVETGITTTVRLGLTDRMEHPKMFAEGTDYRPLFIPASWVKPPVPAPVIRRCVRVTGRPERTKWKRRWWLHWSIG